MALILQANGYPRAHTTSRDTLVGFGAVLTNGTAYTTGGMALNWAGVVNAAGFVEVWPILNPPAPIWVDFQSSGAGATQYTYRWSSAANTMQVFLSGTEIAAGALPAAVVSDLIAFRAEYPKA